MKKSILISASIAVAAAIATALPASAAPLNWHLAFFPTKAACLHGAQVFRADGARVGTLPNGSACGPYNGQYYLYYAYPS